MKENEKLLTMALDGEEVIMGFRHNEKMKAEEDPAEAFAIVTDPDGLDRLGVKLSEKELGTRLKTIRGIYEKGMIPFICPSCGKLYGGSYDIGTLIGFRCHMCGAEWKIKNQKKVEKLREDTRRSLTTQAGQ